ncbi:PP2C family protein-serine/threonine phosphatase [Streptomyces sp. NPDC058665]|uniref:PP2C family protein-serine/threonine phosphatase n=1 Tax=Streptomyces sp. NPDC058665 TaxID=3346586 RepID=UPI003662AA76
MDLVAPQPYLGLPLLAAAPLVGCAILPRRTTAAVAAVVVLTALAVDLERGRPLSATLVDLAVVLLMGVIAVWVNGVVARQRGHLAVARDIAEATQRALLPSPPAIVGSLSVAVRYEAAQAEARIGGDLYAVQETPFGVRAIIGDVIGKGMQAVPAVSAVVGTFQEAADTAPDLRVLAQRLDHALERGDSLGDEDEGAERFTTALLAEIPASGGRITLLSRGHPSPFILCKGRVTPLEPAASALPLGAGLPDVLPDGPLDTFALPADAILLMVTDGVLEARDRQGSFYDPTVALAGRKCAHPKELVDSLVGSVAHWTGGQRQDDMAILALCRTPAIHRQDADTSTHEAGEQRPFP